ncbi:hypothetical protein [Lacticaseibacillus saniviri]|nr:hypothetical protein [Lacticaseibacillus saniviri]
MVEHYAIGFDIGTGSTGFAGVDPNGKLVRMRGKNVYGVYRFKGGEAAADRRGFRTTRRRIKRRKWRLRF